MKILTVVGARPQFIKASMVSKALQERSLACETIVHTGQHFDDNMSGVFFDEMDIPSPKYNLGVGGGSHGQNTGRMIEKIEAVILEERPNWLLVYGDTDSTLAGAIAASKLHVPIAHVESGLRSFNRKMPEEINRIIVDHISELLFTPTDLATRNLETEGIAGAKVRQVGDVMYDASIYFGQIADEKSDLLTQFSLDPKSYAVATIHREENTEDDSRLQSLIFALEAVAEELPVIWPVHPRIKESVKSSTLRLTQPLGYIEMQCLIKNAQVVLTDSGGMQKEAFFHKVPCITFRSETEWVELVASGWNHLAGATDIGHILEHFHTARRGVEHLKVGDWYGKGDASKQIAEVLMR